MIGTYREIAEVGTFGGIAVVATFEVKDTNGSSLRLEHPFFLEEN